jgi:hypothetical protein
MTVIRLASGGLWIHSPIQFSEQLNHHVSQLGEVEVFVAPNVFHHFYLSQWMSRWPDALAFAAPGLMKKMPDIKFSAELNGKAPAVYRGEIEEMIFPGNRVVEEVVFFHRESATLILTDLMLNVHIEHQSWFSRLMARFDQVSFPNGGVPRLFRLSMKDRTVARIAAKKMLDWNPKKIIFCHGDLFTESGGEQIKQKFAWLLGQGN